MKPSAKLLAAITAVASLSIASASVYAATDNGTGQGIPPERGPRFDQETRDAIHQAVEDGDYDTWKGLITQGEGEPKILDFITEENFSKLAEMHQAREDGDKEKAKEIADEIGFKPMMFRGRMGGEQGRSGEHCFGKNGQGGDHQDHPDHVEFERNRRGMRGEDDGQGASAPEGN